MSRNQSEAKPEDNRLLFGRQGMLLFFKSETAEAFISQSGAELRIQDGDVGSDTLSSSGTWKPSPRFP